MKNILSVLSVLISFLLKVDWRLGWAVSGGLLPALSSKESAGGKNRKKGRQETSNPLQLELKPEGVAVVSQGPFPKRRSPALWDCYHGEPDEARKSAVLSHAGGAQGKTEWSNGHGQTLSAGCSHRWHASF